MRLLTSAIILSGGIRPSPLQERLGIPALCLPLSARHTLLSAWLEALASTDNCHEVRIAVSREADAATISSHLESLRGPGCSLPPTQVTAEPDRWRGAAGVICDVAESMPDSEVILVVEASCLPCVAIEPLLARAGAGNNASIGITSNSEPVGVYAFRRRSIECIPAQGFFDIKEQLLPRLFDRGMGAAAVIVADSVIRLRDRAGYLKAVRHVSHRCRRGIRAPHDMSAARISSSAVLDGVCLVDQGALVEDNSLISNSVALNGAIIRSGAVLNHSVVGVNAEVPAGAVVTNTIIPGQIDTSLIDHASPTIRADTISAP